MMRTPKFPTNPLSYSPQYLTVMECGKPDVGEFNRKMKEKRKKYSSIKYG